MGNQFNLNQITLLQIITMTYTQIEIQTTNQAQSEILIALLANIGFEGFEEKENTLQAFIKKEDFI